MPSLAFGPRSLRPACRLWIAALCLSLPGIAPPAFSQEAPPPETKQKPKPKTPPKPKGGGGGTSTSGPAAAPTSTLLLSADMNCTITIDGENPTKVKANEPKKLSVPVGEHLLGAITDDGRRKKDQVVKAAAGSVVVQINLSSEAASTDPHDFDRAAARVWLALSDVVVAGKYAGSILNKSFGFHDKNLSTAVYTAQQFMKRELEEFRKFTPGDPTRKRILDDFNRVALEADKYVDLMTKAITAAQQANSWLGEPNNLYGQAKALETTLVLPNETLNDLKKSQAFTAALPADRRVRLGLPPDPKDYDLGADYYESTPQMLAVVQKGGPADDMGFKAGDRILSAAGKPVSSLSEFKSILRQNAGQRIEVVYERGGKREEKDIKVPAQ